jgi:hypothetical protein
MTESLTKLSDDIKPYLDKFQSKLDKDPNKSIIKSNKFSQGAKYLPIEVLETLLDSLYQGLWKIENLQWKQDLNAVTVSLDLAVFHPVAHIWITRAGIGSVPVEISKETKIISSKALHKNIPAAKSFAFRNAVQSLGRRFGRNLNRDIDTKIFVDTENFKSIFDEKD